jgi:hypothetical protein
MFRNSGGTGGARTSEAAAALEALLTEIEATLASGDSDEACRRAKAVSALVRARRDVAELAELAREQPSEEDVEALRAELRDRLARFADADRAGAPAEVLERIATRGAAE